MTTKKGTTKKGTTKKGTTTVITVLASTTYSLSAGHRTAAALVENATGTSVLKKVAASLLYESLVTRVTGAATVQVVVAVTGVAGDS